MENGDGDAAMYLDPGIGRSVGDDELEQRRRAAIRALEGLDLSSGMFTLTITGDAAQLAPISPPEARRAGYGTASTTSGRCAESQSFYHALVLLSLAQMMLQRLSLPGVEAKVI